MIFVSPKTMAVTTLVTSCRFASTRTRKSGHTLTPANDRESLRTVATTPFEAALQRQRK